MISVRLNSFVFLLITCALGIGTVSLAHAIEGIERTELRRDVLTGKEGTAVIVVSQRFHPGAYMPRHTHHGDEFVYIIKGGTIEVPGPKLIPIKAGSSIRNVRDVPHGGFTVAGDKVIELISIYIVDKVRPLMEIIE